MLAELPGQTLLADIAVIAGALLTISALLVGLSRLRASKWLWRHLVTGPLSEWIDGIVDRVVERKVEPIRAELSFNGGGSVKDKVTKTAETVADLARDVGPVLRDWRTSHPEIRPTSDDDTSP